MFTKRKIKDAINDYESNPDGWYYLPSPKDSWGLETIGIFVDDEYGEHEDEIQKLIGEGWIETLESPMIEDIIYNANSQKDNLNEKDLFEALIYFINNDAFKEF